MSVNQLSRTVALTVVFLLSTACLPSRAQDALWRSYFSSAEHAYQHGEYAQAEKLLKSAAESARRMDDSLTTYYYLGRVYEKLGNLAESERDYKTVLDYLGPKVWAVLRPPDGTPAWDEANGLDTEHTLTAHEFVRMLGHQKQPMQSKLAKPITTVDVLTDLGLLYQEQDKLTEAEQMYRQALMLSELRTESIPFTQPRILQRLAALYAIQGRKAESDALLKQLEDLRNQSLPEFDQIVRKNIHDLDRPGRNRLATATKLNNLALFCATQGDYSRADELYVRALSLFDSNSSHASLDLSIILRNYADLLEAMGRNDEAHKYVHKAEALSTLADSKLLQQKSPAPAQKTGETTKSGE